ncbi:MAG: hypothetical protein JXB07_17705 [Anaerolineae bacterium]|nr:hypothetical protein [Anaerolineae bacterium]
MSIRLLRAAYKPVSFLAVLILATLACNIPREEVGSALTVQAIYVTITAQASAAPTRARSTDEGTSTQNQTTTPANTITPTPPENRTGNGSNLVIPRCTTSITIDANDDDWVSQSGVLGVSLNQNTYGASEWTGSSDLSGHARLCWNENRLYFFVGVTDDIHVQEQRGDTSWKGDEVEILFDADLRGDFYKAVWDGDDYQVSLNPGNFDDLASAAYRYHPTTGTPRGIEMAASGAETGGNYKLEAAMLLSADLGINLSAGQTFGLCVALSDNDHPGEARQDSMVSHCTRLKVSDPTTWITVTLE